MAFLILKFETMRPVKNEEELLHAINEGDGLTSNADDGIIDISDEESLIPLSDEMPKVIKSPVPVPAWPHKYIFGSYEIDYAGEPRREFYTLFKEAFLRNECLDVEGNTNYLFNLLFELLDEYKIHGEIDRIEEQIRRLGDAYPATRSYGISHLVRLIAEKESHRSELFQKAARHLILTQEADLREVSERFHLSASETEQLFEQLEEAGVITRSPGQQKPAVAMTNVFQIRPLLSEESEQRLIAEFPDFFWSLGQRYAQTLELDKKSKRILDQVKLYENNFNSIEFLKLETLKLFLKGVLQLDNHYLSQGGSLSRELNTMGDLLARKHYRYRLNSRNYNATLQSAPEEIYSALFRVAENVARQHYGVNRKIGLPPFCENPAVTDSEGNSLFSLFEALVRNEAPSLAAPDESTESALNRRNPSRWKIAFNALLAPFEGASKIPEKEATAALAHYLRYVRDGLDAGRSYRPLSAALKKKLFANEEQAGAFEEIIRNYADKREFEDALQRISRLYIPVRRKIRIDPEQVRHIQHLHSRTVALLNDYLQEEEEVLLLPEPTVSEKKEDSTDQNPRCIVTLNGVQQQLLTLFRDNGFTLSVARVRDFAKEHGYFRNQLIEAVNDLCYETLDDLLIEEEEEHYTINPEYYNLIFES